MRTDVGEVLGRWKRIRFRCWRGLGILHILPRMELEIRHLRILCAIADMGSMHKAARLLGVTQPSLSSQMRRIERSLGAELFYRVPTGCHPTPLGRSVLGRARPLLTQMTELVAEARATAVQSAGARFRVGSTGSKVTTRWLRRIKQRLADAETALVVDKSPSALVRMVASGHLDVALVHELEGMPLSIPQGLSHRVVVDREPQFVSLARDHPAAAQSVIDLHDLAADRWVVDPMADGEWVALRQVLDTAGLRPAVVPGDPATAASLIAIGEAVASCQPTTSATDHIAVRPLRGDPLGVACC